MAIPQGTARIFEDAAELRPEDAARVTAALARVAGLPGTSRRSRPDRILRAGVARAARTVGALVASSTGEPSEPAGQRCSLPSAAALDIAAELVEIADRMHAAGHFLEGFALEGIEGRLIEALVIPRA